jgi:hypothetical protein
MATSARPAHAAPKSIVGMSGAFADPGRLCDDDAQKAPA